MIRLINTSKNVLTVSPIVLLIVILSLSLWCSALFLPGFKDLSPPVNSSSYIGYPGWNCFLAGFMYFMFAPFSNISIAWYSNFPFFAAFPFLFVGRPLISTLLTCIASLCSLMVLNITEISAFQVTYVAVGVGAYIWIFSIFLLLCGSILAQLMLMKKSSQTRSLA